jgi:hypothetical protein
VHAPQACAQERCASCNLAACAGCSGVRGRAEGCTPIAHRRGCAANAGEPPRALRGNPAGAWLPLEGTLHAARGMLRAARCALCRQCREAPRCAAGLRPSLCDWLEAARSLRCTLRPASPAAHREATRRGRVRAFGVGAAAAASVSVCFTTRAASGRSSGAIRPLMPAAARRVRACANFPVCLQGGVVG